MSNIEFRVWDMEIGDGYMDYDTYDEYINGEGNIFELEEESYGCMGTQNLMKDITNKKSVMRYTGIKDKDNVKIFEDDIVKFLHWKPKQIVYCDKNFAGFSLKGTDLLLTTREAKRMKVIGNIYETPERINKFEE